MTPRQKFMIAALMLASFTLGACWMYKHLNCPTCQQGGHNIIDRVRRTLGMRILPNN